MNLFTNSLELTACAAFMLVWAVALYTALSYGKLARMVKKSNGEDSPEPSPVLPPLTVVITAHNQGEQLHRNLPHILEQDYETFEVVVVNNHSTDETEDVLKILELKYPHLSHTFTPKSARYISQKRLSLTLGFRAARYDWVILTEADCRPDSPQWLSALGRECAASPARQIVLGYANYTPASSWFARKIIFFRLYNLMMLLPYSARHAAYRADSANMAFRKSLFLRNKGFTGHVNLICGAEELLVNRNSSRSNTAVALHRRSFIRQELPPAKRLWKQERMSYMETRKHFRHKWLFRIRYHIKSLLPWWCLLTFATAAGLSYLHRNYPVAATVTAFYLIYIIAKDIAFNRSCRALGEKSYHLQLFLFEWAIPLWNISAWLAYKTHSRYHFRKKII